MSKFLVSTFNRTSLESKRRWWDGRKPASLIICASEKTDTPVSLLTQNPLTHKAFLESPTLKPCGTSPRFQRKDCWRIRFTRYISQYRSAYAFQSGILFRVSTTVPLRSAPFCSVVFRLSALGGGKRRRSFLLRFVPAHRR